MSQFPLSARNLLASTGSQPPALFAWAIDLTEESLLSLAPRSLWRLDSVGSRCSGACSEQFLRKLQP